MKTVTVRALRNSFPKVLAAARKNGAVGVTRHGKVVATLSAESVSAATKPATPWTPPNFKNRLKEDFGGKIMPFSYVDFMER